MTDQAITYEWHTVTRRARFAISALCIIAFLWMGCFAKSRPQILVSFVFAFGAVAVLVNQRVKIDPTTREVSREITLGKLCLWSSRWSLEEFKMIGAYRLPGGSPQASMELVHVGLKPATGSLLTLRCFGVRRGQPCPEAELFAHSLEETTHLKFQGTA